MSDTAASREGSAVTADVADRERRDLYGAAILTAVLTLVWFLAVGLRLLRLGP